MRRLLRKDFTCVATDLNAREPIYFSPDNTPDTKIADAIIMSCTLPLLYAPLKYNEHLMVDGGLTHLMPRNTPIDETLFIYFGQSQADTINSLNDYLYMILSMAFDRDDGGWFKTRPCIALELPPSLRYEKSIDFEINRQGVEARIMAGYASTIASLYPNCMSTIGAVIYMVYETILEQYFLPEFDVES